MSKENVSATVDSDVAEWLDQDGRNRSETINKAVKQYMKAGGNERAMIELRLEQLRSRKTNLEGELETVDAEIAKLKARLDSIKEEKQEQKEETIEEMVKRFKPASWLSAVPKHRQMPDRDNHKLKECADNTDMTPTELSEKMAEYVKENYE